MRTPCTLLLDPPLSLIFELRPSFLTHVPRVLSPGQTIATCQRNMSQHCWAHHIACVKPQCCDMLGVVGSNMTIFKFEPTTANNVATCCVGMLRSGLAGALHSDPRLKTFLVVINLRDLHGILCILSRIL